MKPVLALFLAFSATTAAFVGPTRPSRGPQNRRNNLFRYLDKEFLDNERAFVRSYHDYRSRNLAGSQAPLLISNAQENESPADIQAILRKNNITGSVVIITNFESLPSQPVVSKFELDPTPFHHPYYFNAEQSAKASIDSAKQTQQLMSTQSPYANLVFPPQPITFRDIPTVMVIANSVMTIYNYFEGFIPGTNSTSADKSTLEKVQGALIMYAKIRVLVKTFVQKRDQISQQVSFLGSHLLGLQTSEIDMISFNGLESKYFSLKTASQKYANDTRAGKIRSAWSSISTEAINFDDNMKQIVNATLSLIKMAMMFDEVLASLNQIVQSNARKLGLLDFLSDVNILDAAQKSSVLDVAKGTGFLDTLQNSSLVQAIENSDLFQKIKNSSFVQGVLGGRSPWDIIKSVDTFMMGLVKLVKSRRETTSAIGMLQNSLTAFKVRRNTLTALLNEIQKEVDQLNTANLLKKNAWRVSVAVMLLLGLLFKW